VHDPIFYSMQEQRVSKLDFRDFPHKVSAQALQPLLTAVDLELKTVGVHLGLWRGPRAGFFAVRFVEIFDMVHNEIYPSEWD
jgi:hypothetical protein